MLARPAAVLPRRQLLPTPPVQVNYALYDHHGIDIGEGIIVSNNQEGIRRQTLEEFANNRPVLRVVYKPGKVCFTAEEIAARAESLVDTKYYNLVHFNCEHFAIWCCTGVFLSRQVGCRP